ncbi:MAG: response regulator transcription factor [Bryobacterales bacterium]|nr:response regulator transcription factor [Bryobacterales bacterium]
MARILVVEDEADIAMLLADDLRLEGHEVFVVSDGGKASGLGREGAWDLIVLDVMLPKKDGFEVCRELRKVGVRTPIILLTAKSHEAEKIMGLDLGADDYVTKPFNPRELRARIRALLRRIEGDYAGSVRFGEVEVQPQRAEVRLRGQLVDLTPMEFKLLLAFTRNRGRVLSRDQLIDLAWGRDTYVTERAVDAHIVNLRRKIEPGNSEPRHIVSVRGMGYRFDE